MTLDNARISSYLNATRFMVLATVADGKPALRTMAAFAAEGIAPVFSTHKDTDKVRHIEANPYVSILFEHEKQNLRTFINMTVSGIAVRIDDKASQEHIIRLIGARNLRYQERAARGDLVEQVFYRVEPIEIKIIDFRKSPSPAGVELIRFLGQAETEQAA
ncbi:MAG TPA: pyridoxamine 5'-phosphate oxidase family protein [Geobacteraceae bacterium]